MPNWDSWRHARILVLDRGGELAARIRHNVVPPDAKVQSCHDTIRAEELLAAGYWDVVVAGPSLLHRGGLRRLAGLHRRHPWVATVLALHERPRADLAEIVGVGADDLVPLYADDAELGRTLARAARITRGRLGVTADGRGGADRGRVVMVSSASGGCGKTFLATNAAEFLARTTGQLVVLVDLDLQFGEVSTALRLRPLVTITDALAAEAEGYDLEDILDDFLLPHPDGFKVLAAPRLPAEADSVTPGDVARLLDVLRARRAWVVIDTHEGLSDLFLAALDATDHVFAVATPDRPSLVNLNRFVGALERLGMDAANISVVLNKADGDLPEVAGDCALTIPYSRDVPRSINVGVPLLVGKPKSPISTLLATALPAALAAKPQPAPVTTPKPEPVPKPKPEPEPEPDSVVLVDEPVEIDLTEAPTRACPAIAAAWPVTGTPGSPPRSISPHSYPALARAPPSNGPAGL